MVIKTVTSLYYPEHFVKVLSVGREVPNGHVFCSDHLQEGFPTFRSNTFELEPHCMVWKRPAMAVNGGGGSGVGKKKPQRGKQCHMEQRGGRTDL